MKKIFASMIAAAFLFTGSVMAGATTKSPTMASAKKTTAKSMMIAHSKLAKKHAKKHAVKMSAKKSIKKIAKKKHALKKTIARKLHRKHNKHTTKRHNRM